MTDSEELENESVTTRKPWSLRKLLVAIGGFFVLVFGALLMLLVATLTLFRSRRFCSEVPASGMA